MQKHERMVLQTMQALADQAQLDHRVEYGKKHVAFVVIDHGGGEHKLPVSSSPRSDEKSLMNMAAQQFRRLLRSLCMNDDGTKIAKAS